AALLCWSNVAGCKRHDPSYSRPGDDPHDTDSLYVLYRRMLTDSDPKPTWAQVNCAVGRLMERLGPEEAVRRYQAMRDTVYTPAEEAAWPAIDRKLALHAYSLDDATCGPGFEGHYTPDTAAAGVRPPPNPAR
ncbi:MAG: hypothetical protein KGN74_07515, partial [Gemmatimonadota bacterium]|nr:hypothetical protein [Gemmatimonadota bacterium]